jgi:hypothetical protein
MEPTSSLPYEKPTPRGYDKNKRFEASLQQYGLAQEVRLAVTLHLPSSIFPELAIRALGAGIDFTLE